MSTRPHNARRVDLAISLASLFVPLVIGVIAGRARVFEHPPRAIDALNAFALHLAFPALVVVSLSDPRTSIAQRPAFLAMVPLSLVLSLALVRALTSMRAEWRERAGTIALVVAFGNTAYLGLPYVAAVLGDDALSTAAVAVAIHVACAMTFGPVLLARWSGGGEGAGRAAMVRVMKQPLLWSPLLGLALRVVPIEVLQPMRAVIEPLGRTAAPISMVLLGLYLWENRARMHVDGDVAAHVAARLVLVPAVTAALVIPARAWGWIDVVETRVLLLLAAMPTAITTFSIALEQRIGSDRVATAIVVSTVVSVLTLGAITWIALELL